MAIFHDRATHQHATAPVEVAAIPARLSDNDFGENGELRIYPNRHDVCMRPPHPGSQGRGIRRDYIGYWGLLRVAPELYTFI